MDKIIHVVPPPGNPTPGEPTLNDKVFVRRVASDGSLPDVPSGGVILTIEDNYRRIATATAEEITDAVFGIFSLAPLPSDPVRKEQALLKMHELKRRIFHTVQPVLNRRMAALERAVEKKA